MAQLAVSRLHLRSPPALVFRATARAEEALRLAAPEGERLLVLRRLPLGRLPVSGAARLWQARADAAMRDAGARAVHGGSPGAATAEAVWFASVAEARFLLLRELAAGRRAEAWFWRLAVPEWGGATLDGWMPRLATRALADPMEDVALAQAVMRLAETGLLAPVARALAGVPSLPRPIAPATTSPFVATSPAMAPASIAPRLAARLLARHPPASRTALLAMLRAAPPEAKVARWLARLALVAVAPEALAQRDLFDAMVAAIISEAALAANASAIVAVCDPAAAPTTPGHATAAPEAPAAKGHPADIARPDAVPARAVPAGSGASQDGPAAPSHPAPSPVVTPASPDTEHRSRGAGVLLLVRPLMRMGLPAWLERHHGLAAEGFGRALLRHVAWRMRIPPEDPLFAMLGACDEAPGAMPDAWRIGLDSWLRRRARRRLVDVARRPGWLKRCDDSLVVRFAADAADLRLRRLALDVDPGWVPWLGLVIRYHFRDEPLP